MDPQLIPIFTAMIAAGSALLGALLGATIGARTQFALDDRRALRERRARNVDPFLEWVHGRTGFWVDAIQAARDGDIERAREVLDDAAQGHPFRDTRWRAVMSADFKKAAYEFTRADSAARVLAEEYIRAVELHGTGALDMSGQEPAVLSKLRTTAGELEEAADRYVLTSVGLLPFTPTRVLPPLPRLRRRS